MQQVDPCAAFKMQPRSRPVTLTVDLWPIAFDGLREIKNQGTESVKSVPNKSITRRALLQGVGTTGLVLPFLESIPERSAFALDEDPRFAFFMCGANGVVQDGGLDPERFWPKVAGPLSPAQLGNDSAQRCTGLLADHADKLLIVRGMRYSAGATGDTHAHGHVMCLTGLTPEGSSVSATSRGPSIDWVIAQAAGGTPLNVYAGPHAGYIDDRLSFRAAGELVDAERDPYQVYLQLAGLLDADGTQSEEARRLFDRRKSVNDLVRGDLSSLLSDPRLSSSDRRRLDQHLTAIRDVEVTMEALGCSADQLSLEEIETIGDKGFIENVVRLHMQLVGVAFACNVTRAATLQWGDGGGDGSRYVIDGVESFPFHWISHRVQSDGASGAAIEGAVEMHAEIDRIRMRTLKTLLDHWSELTTPRGPLFESALALWTCDVAEGPSGSHRNLPLIIAGSPGGKLLQAHYLDLPSFTNTSLLKSLLDVCGVESASFAEEANVSPLADVLV